MNFHKLQALGNDFVIFGNPAQTHLPDKDLIRFICDRHYGIGADCAVFISSSENADFGMHVYNPDGFEAEICGNALRCSAQYITECGFFKKRNYFAETRSGIRQLKVNASDITVQIGKPEIISEGILEVSGITLPYLAVSLGNPHCVIFTSGINDSEFRHLGYSIEHHPIFPEGTNVEFAAVSGGNRIAMRVWERGIGETLSCSTGSCACAAAAFHKGYCDGSVKVHQSGGIIEVETAESGEMYITGRCNTVFKGTLLK